jgi:hypothetical protein
MSSPRKPATLVATCLILALPPGCSTASRGEKMMQGYSRTRETVADARTSVDAVIASLSALRTLPTSTLGDGFGSYKDAVAQLESAGESAEWRSGALEAETEEHIRSWQEEMSSIQDPTIKTSLESRRAAVRSNFKLVQMYAADARKAYEPFLRGNKDLVKALSIDLSPAAVSGLTPAIDRVLSDGNALRQRLAALDLALTNIANGISPLGE